MPIEIVDSEENMKRVLEKRSYLLFFIQQCHLHRKLTVVITLYMKGRKRSNCMSLGSYSVMTQSVPFHRRLAWPDRAQYVHLALQ